MLQRTLASLELSGPRYGTNDVCAQVLVYGRKLWCRVVACVVLRRGVGVDHKVVVWAGVFCCGVGCCVVAYVVAW